jgi:hypothetical protein
MGEVDLIAYLLDQAFDGGEFHSLMGNLGAVDRATWRARVPGSVRTIAEIALHVGGAKVMYDDHAFGTASLVWDSPEVAPWTPGAAPLPDVLAWLGRSHADLMAHVRALSDADLLVPRRANWGELRETRWLLSTVLQHDVYHAGEINRTRSLLVGEDRWRWQIEAGIDR